MPSPSAGVCGCAERLPRNGWVIDAAKLIVVALVRMLVRAWVIRVVHARPKVRVAKVLVLVIKPEGMPDLLADYYLAPGWSVVRTRVEVAVVQLDGACGDVISTDPDLRQPKPAVEAVPTVTDLHRPRSRPPAVASSRTGRCIEDGGLAPVLRSGVEVRCPRRTQIVAQRNGERVALSGQGSGRYLVLLKRTGRQGNCYSYSRRLRLACPSMPVLRELPRLRRRQAPRQAACLIVNCLA